MIVNSFTRGIILLLSRKDLTVKLKWDIVSIVLAGSGVPVGNCGVEYIGVTGYELPLILQQLMVQSMWIDLYTNLTKAHKQSQLVFLEVTISQPKHLWYKKVVAKN